VRQAPVAERPVVLPPVTREHNIGSPHRYPMSFVIGSPKAVFLPKQPPSSFKRGF